MRAAVSGGKRLEELVLGIALGRPAPALAMSRPGRRAYSCSRYRARVCSVRSTAGTVLSPRPGSPG